MSSGESDYNRAADMCRAPLYTPQQMAAQLLDLYTFLTTLHFDPADLKVAPVDGWPDLTPEHCAHFRGDYALHVLRYLPYLGGRPPQDLHYQCKVIDYTAVDRAWFVKHHMDGDTEEWWSTLSQVPAAWILPLALGVSRESSSFYLNVIDAEVYEVISGLGYGEPKPLDAWVNKMKQLFTCLQLIPCNGKLTLVCEEVEDIETRISEDEFRAEEGYFPTDLDVRFIRQVYREYGWPEKFQYKEAMTYLLPVVEDIAEDNDDRWWMDWM